jgi:hypothetical protein
MGDQSDVSCRRARTLPNWIPHFVTPRSPTEKRSCDNGIRTSAVHPAESTLVALAQTASHNSSFSESLYRNSSRCTPLGDTAKMNDVRRSKYESIPMRIQSE